MFSITTMASSTTKPLAMASAISDRLSSEKPHRYMMAQVPMSETGTATAGMSVARTLRRKMKTTAMTSTTEMISVRSISRHRGADGQRAVENRDQMLAARDGRLQRRKRGLHRIHGRDNVGAGLAENDHVDGGLAVEKAGLPHGLLRVDNVGDVLAAARRRRCDSPPPAACSRRPSRSDRWQRCRRSHCRRRTGLSPDSSSGRPPLAAPPAG